jgi:hypothetical protein
VSCGENDQSSLNEGTVSNSQPWYGHVWIGRLDSTGRVPDKGQRPRDCVQLWALMCSGL